MGRAGAAVLAAWALTALSACTLVGTQRPEEAAPSPPREAPGPRRVGGRPPAVVPEPEPPRPSLAPRVETEARRISAGVVETALAALGTPYEWGGTSENGFDCSGLIQYAYARHGIELPRVSRDQIRAGRQVTPRLEELEPGDILGFAIGVGGVTSHVGLYLGDGEFIHSGSDGVQVSDLRDSYWRTHLVAATRVVG